MNIVLVVWHRIVVYRVHASAGLLLFRADEKKSHFIGAISIFRKYHRLGFWNGRQGAKSAVTAADAVIVRRLPKLKLIKCQSKPSEK